MVTITMTQNDRSLLLRMLDNYKSYRYEEYDKGKINVLEFKYDLDKINLIIGIVQGKIKSREDYQQNSKAYREKNGRIKNIEDVKTPWTPLPFKK